MQIDFVLGHGKAQVKTLLPISMMPEGLANGMSIEDFASLVHFLAAQKQ